MESPVPWVRGVEYNKDLEAFSEGIITQSLAAEIFTGFGETLCSFAKHYTTVLVIDDFMKYDGVDPMALITANHRNVIPIRTAVDVLPKSLPHRIFDFVHILPYKINQERSVRFAVEQWQKVTRYLAVPTAFKHMVLGQKEIYSKDTLTGFQCD